MLASDGLRYYGMGDIYIHCTYIYVHRQPKRWCVYIEMCTITSIIITTIITTSTVVVIIIIIAADIKTAITSTCAIPITILLGVLLPLLQLILLLLLLLMLFL